jgi:ERCC4-type nuclease
VIIIDKRRGSGELAPLFKGYGIDILEDMLDFADFCFTGNGPNGTVSIGMERKRIGDLISSMRDKRFSGYQLPGLVKNYEYVYLIIEGISRPSSNGNMEVYRKGKWYPLLVGSKMISYREIDHHMATLGHVCGLTIISTSTPEHTAAMVVSRYKWWNDKQWNKHDSYMQIYTPLPESTGRARLLRHHVGLVEKVAAQFIGVDKKAFEFGKKFKSIKDLMNASVGDLEKVVGKKLAGNIYNQINGKER